MDRAIGRQFAYNAWANRRVAASLRTITGSPDRARTLFAHVLNAERIWLGRILDEPGPLPLPWDERTPDECDRMLEENQAAYARFLDSDRAGDDGSMIDYRNFAGDPFRTPLRDILQHVLMHGSYHRGQIATAVKAGGGVPASTDFILFARELSE